VAVNYTNLFTDIGSFLGPINLFRNSAKGSTPVADSALITGVTQANPVVVTCAAGHSLVTNDRIRIDGVVGTVEVNATDFTVRFVSSTTFELVGIDGSAHTGYTSGGVSVRYIDRPNMQTLLDAIETALNTSGRHDVLNGVNPTFEVYRDTLVGWASELSGKVDERLGHKSTILDELIGAGSFTDVQTLLGLIHRDMVDNAQDVLLSTVTIGAVSADGGNTGDGTVETDKVLDAVSVAFAGGSPVVDLRDVDSELAVTSETMSLTCVVDEDTDGVPAGEEVFLWEGEQAPNSPLDWRNEGSGVSLEIPTLNSHSIIANRNFDSFTANVPESWDLDNGTAGTHLVQESTAADVFRGESAVRFDGDGAQAEIGISQTIPLRALTPGKRYKLTCQVQGQAGIAAGTLTIQFESPSSAYTAGASEKITMNAAALAAQVAYGIESFFFTVPVTIPDDLELVIKVTGTLTTAKSVWVDSLAFGPVEWGGGVSVVISAGATQFVRGDRFTFTVVNDDAGVFQTFFRKRYKTQLPSAASPSIAENLASAGS